MGLLGSALTNARGASASIAEAVAERLRLTSALDAAVEEPGHLHALSPEECREVLRNGSVGRLAYIARAGVPDIVPVNYVVDGRDLLIRSGPGPKLQAAERRELVAFEVDDLDPATRTGRSVVLHGRAERESGDAATDRLPWAAGPRRHLIRIRATRTTGRRLS
jgi:hypothetical protein